MYPWIKISLLKMYTITCLIFGNNLIYRAVTIWKLFFFVSPEDITLTAWVKILMGKLKGLKSNSYSGSLELRPISNEITSNHLATQLLHQKRFWFHYIRTSTIHMRKTLHNPGSAKQDPTCISPCGQKIGWGAYFKLCTQQIYFRILSSWPDPFSCP